VSKEYDQARAENFESHFKKVTTFVIIYFIIRCL
jgi:hypothetical protein